MTVSKLPARPSLDSLRKQARKLARDVAGGDGVAIARALTQLPKAEVPLSQRNAQLVLAREYGFPDYAGRRPDWGRHKIDFAEFPPVWMDLFRTGGDLEVRWLTTLTARAKKFRAKVP